MYLCVLGISISWKRSNGVFHFNKLLFLKPMKIVSNNVYFKIIFLFGFVYAFAGSGNAGPPAPTAKQNAATASAIPPPPGVPIDENIVVLLIVALLFGTYIIYLNYIKTKNTI